MHLDDPPGGLRRVRIEEIYVKSTGEKAMHVLLVEDEADHVDLIRRAFASAPQRVDVTVAGSLSEARARLAESVPDLAIVDLLLPDGRGTELLPPDGGELPFPVVIMTAYGDEAAAVEAMKAGALDYVAKSDGTFADMPHIAERILREWGYIAERKRMVTRLLAQQKRLRAVASELVMAEERERRRIAAGIHDSIAQSLVVSKMRLQSMRTRLAGTPEAAELDGVIDLMERSGREARALTFELSPPILFESGLRAAAQWLVEGAARENGLRFTFEYEGREGPLSDDLRSVLFRALKELVTNVVKHARTEKARVLLKQAAGEVHLRVDDDGVGFSPTRPEAARGVANGFGLFSIRERIGCLGGRMEIESSPGQGTAVTLVVPLNDNRQSQD
jgi:signal transduction histidine kinase